MKRFEKVKITEILILDKDTFSQIYIWIFSNPKVNKTKTIGEDKW